MIEITSCKLDGDSSAKYQVTTDIANELMHLISINNARSDAPVCAIRFRTSSPYSYLPDRFTSVGPYPPPDRLGSVQHVRLIASHAPAVSALAC